MIAIRSFHSSENPKASWMWSFAWVLLVLISIHGHASSSMPQSIYLCSSLDESEIVDRRESVGVRLQSLVEAVSYLDEDFSPVMLSLFAMLTPVDGWLQAHSARRSAAGSFFFDIKSADFGLVIDELFGGKSREEAMSLSELENFYSELERRAEETGAIYDGSALLVEIEFVERADDRLSLVASVSREYFGAAPADIRSSGPLYRFEIPINPVEPEIRLPVMSSSGLDVEGRLYDLVISEATMTDLTGPVLWSSSEPATN